MSDVTTTDRDAVLEVAAAVGVGLLESACSAGDTVESVRRICAAGGLDHVKVNVAHKELHLSHRFPGEVPTVRLELIGGRDFDYGRQTRYKEVAQGITDGRLDFPEASRQLATLAAAPGRYPGWFGYPLAGSAGAAAAIMFGGDGRAAVAAFLANVALAWLLPRLGGRGWPVFYLQMVAGLLGQLTAAALTVLDPGVDASVVVIAVLLIMFAGMTTTGAVKDAVTGWELTATGRLLEALVNTTGLVVGIQAGLLMSDRLGVHITLDADVARADLPLWGLVVAGAFVGGAFSLVAQSAPRVAFASAALAAANWLVFAFATEQAGLGAAWASGLAATFAGVCGVLLARRLRACVDGFAVASVVPLMPGILLYQGLWQLGTDGPGAAQSLVGAGATALALAVGLTFGEYLGAGIAHRLSHAVDHLVPVFRRVRRDRPGGHAG